MNIVLICARKESKGLKNKNIKFFCGAPLISWTIKQAKKIKNIDKIIVSTDSKKIARISRKYGAEVPFLRPKSLAGDQSKELFVWKHAIKLLEKNYKTKINLVLSLPATSPNRKLKDINRAIQHYMSKNFDFVMCVAKSNKNPYFNMVSREKSSKIKILISKKGIYNRQQAPSAFNITTVANVSSAKFILSNKSIFEGKVGSIVVQKENSIDIDDKEDFEYAEYLFKKQKYN